MRTLFLGPTRGWTVDSDASRQPLRRILRWTLTGLGCLLFAGATWADDDDTRRPLDDEGRVVNFQRDIAPLFRTHCLECHNEKEAKADFRIDESDSVFSYVEAGNVESSVLYTDYLLSDDDDLLMPPRSHGGPLPAADLALVRLWIEEGADWPSDAVFGNDATVIGVAAVADLPGSSTRGLFARVWAFQGFFHPATVHFPIALLLVGAAFVVLSWKWPILGTQIPLTCLLLGTAAAIVASMMGWAFATERGYGSWDKVDFDGEIFWHRWSGLIVALMATCLSVIALLGLRRNSSRMQTVWKSGLLVIAGLVGLVGHQGGELTYGKDMYPKAFRILLNQPEPAKATQKVTPDLEQVGNENDLVANESRPKR